MAQEVGVRSVQDLKQFGSDLKRLSEQLSNAFHAAEKKMNHVCEGWNDTSNQKFMTEFQKDRNMGTIYGPFIGKELNLRVCLNNDDHNGTYKLKVQE